MESYGCPMFLLKNKDIVNTLIMNLINTAYIDFYLGYDNVSPSILDSKAIWFTSKESLER